MKNVTRKFRLITWLAVLWLASAGVTAQESIKVDNTVRRMITHVPDNLPYNPPLVISLHGMQQDAAYQRNQTGWDAVADTAKFVVVYPEGLNKAWDIGGMTDIRFLEVIIDTMYARCHINRNRVYLTGFSMGGMMTYHAMARMGDKIAAFGPVSGIPVDYREPSGVRPVPFIHTHGTADNVVYYNGDPNHAAGGYGSVPEYVKKWAQFDGCSLTPEVIKPYPCNKPGSAATYTRYAGGKDGTEVVLISIEGKGHWHSNDMASVHTTSEIWNFCKRYALGPEEPEPPAVVSAKPEDRSFDLPTDCRTYEFVFNEPVDGSKAVASLTGPDGISYKLRPEDKGWNEALVLKLPDGAVLPDGSYTLMLDSVVNEKGGQMKLSRWHYTYGWTEVGLALDIDTLLLPDWYAERAVVGEGIPYGWLRVNSRADGSEDRKGSGDANTGGARLKYFMEGGDFDAGFYLSARDYDRCVLSYGQYEGNRLHLLPGKYLVSFNSVYWSAGSHQGQATFDMTVTDMKTGHGWIERTGLLSAGCMDEVSDCPVSGSQRHEYEFEVSEESDCVLSFSMSQGWNSVIVGNVKLTTAPSVADVYKGGFVRMMARAEKIYRETQGERYADSEALREELGGLMEEYVRFTSTSPTEYERVIGVLRNAVDPLERRKLRVDLYFQAFEKADSVLEQCTGNEYYEQTEAYVNLKEALAHYNADIMDLTDEAALVTAAETLDSLTGLLLDVVTDIRPAENWDRLLGTDYFDMSGRPVKGSVKGPVIVREKWSEGGIRTGVRFR